MRSVFSSIQGSLPHDHRWLAALVLGGGHNVAGGGCGGYMGTLWGLYGGVGDVLGVWMVYGGYVGGCIIGAILYIKTRKRI